MVVDRGRHAFVDNIVAAMITKTLYNFDRRIARTIPVSTVSLVSAATALLTLVDQRRRFYNNRPRSDNCRLVVVVVVAEVVASVAEVVDVVATMVYNIVAVVVGISEMRANSTDKVTAS